MNGLQHYKHIPFFHRNGNNLQYQQQRDRLKVDYAIDNGIILMIVDYSNSSKDNIMDCIDDIRKAIY